MPNNIMLSLNCVFLKQINTHGHLEPQSHQPAILLLFIEGDETIFCSERGLV